MTVYLGSDLQDVMRLKGLLGQRASGLPPNHPLAAGFAAAERELTAQRPLTVEEKRSLAELKLFGRAIFQLESDWAPYEDRLVTDLVDPEACLSLLFELHVITFALQGRVQQITWTRYAEATPDIATTGPEMLVECTLHRSDKVFRVEQSLEAKRRQHQGVSMSYVVAVGFDHEFTQAEIERVTSLAEGLKPWFMDHADVSAGLIFTPARPSDKGFDAYGFPATEVRHGACTEVINWAAEHPLPRGFTFRSGAPVRTEG